MNQSFATAVPGAETVNNVVKLEWHEVFLRLLDNSPQVINGLIHKAEDVAFYKVWHDYGLRAGAPERTWAYKYGQNSGLAPMGMIAMEFLRRGLAGEDWETTFSAITEAVRGRKLPNGRWLKMGDPHHPCSPKRRHKANQSV